jgi:hypothetical protein
VANTYGEAGKTYGEAGGTYAGFASTDVTPTFSGGGWPRSGQAIVLSTATGSRSAGGYMRTSGNGLAATTTTTGMTWQEGFKRRPNSAGFPFGPLVYELNGTVAYYQNGLGRTSTGVLAVTTSTSSISRTGSNGFWRDTSGRLVVAINTAS